jgi:hypothetical protein
MTATSLYEPKVKRMLYNDAFALTFRLLSFSIVLRRFSKENSVACPMGARAGAPAGTT